ncbi:MAG: tail fiber domain-containing protein [Candidatus Levybacteria bacterium]|nr:tail fiber domain-containing protein [Candidatus Levybacteria bacterium]
MIVTGNSTYSGDLTVTGTATAAHFDNVSDITLKSNVHSIMFATELLDQLNPVTFNWKSDNTRSFGLIAQDVEKIIPEIVRNKENGIKSVAYIELIPLLITALREQKDYINGIEEKLNNLSSNPGRKSKMTKKPKNSLPE